MPTWLIIALLWILIPVISMISHAWRTSRAPHFVHLSDGHTMMWRRGITTEEWYREVDRIIEARGHTNLDRRARTLLRIETLTEAAWLLRQPGRFDPDDPQSLTPRFRAPSL